MVTFRAHSGGSPDGRVAMVTSKFRIRVKSDVRLSLLLIGPLLVACGQGPESEALTLRRSALTGGSDHLVVPAYFLTDSNDWTTLRNAMAPGDVVIVTGENSGPGTYNAALDALIQNFDNAQFEVYGYVYYGEGITTQDIEGQIATWHNYYHEGLAGIYFDQAHRDTDDDLPHFKHVMNVVQLTFQRNGGGYGIPMFNINPPPHTRNYIDCLTRQAAFGLPNGDDMGALFVSQENSADFYRDQVTLAGLTNSQYWADATWSFVNAYNPDHFVHLIHDVPVQGQTPAQLQAATQDILARGRSWNASGVYVTDGLLSGNTWGTLAQATIHAAQVQGTSGNSNYPGVEDETFTSTCPASAESAPLAFNPSPPDGSGAMGTGSTMAWTPAAGATSHDVYFGSSRKPKFRGTQSGTSFNPGTMQASTTYYWRVNERRSTGVDLGPLWRFTTAAATALFSDDFQTGNTSRWNLHSGSWSIANDDSKVLKQSNAVGDARASSSSSSWGNQTVVARVTPLSWNGSDRFVAVFARFQDVNNYYYATLRSSGKVEIKKLVAGSSTVLATKSFPVSTNNWYRVRFSVSGTSLKLYVDDALQLSASDSRFTTGRAGVGTFNATAQFDDVVVNP